MGLADVVFWKYKKNKKGKSLIFIRIIEERKPRYLKTGLSSTKEDWDFSKNQFKTKYRKAEDQYKVAAHEKSNEILNMRVRDAENLIKDLIHKDGIISSEQVKNELVHSRNIGKDSVLHYIDSIVEEKQRHDKIGTATCYKDLKRSLLRFIKKRDISDISFKEITTTFLKDYENDFRERKIKDTGISFYFRTLRAVCNRAIEDGTCRRDMYPFDKYKISHFKTHTTKRAITKAEIEKIKQLPLEADSSLSHSRNIFLFSYYCSGINFSDISMLTWENIKKNRLIYVRLKTNKPYNLMLLDPCLEIIDYYKTNYFRGSNTSIFPIIDIEKHTTQTTIKNRIHKVLGQTNKDLKQIGEMVNLEIPLTTYVARHTFATVMKRGGVSTSIISESLGHDSERTTQIYLDSFANDVLDEASKTLL